MAVLSFSLIPASKISTATGKHDIQTAKEFPQGIFRHL